MPPSAGTPGRSVDWLSVESPPGPVPPSTTPLHSRECSSSRAALAARSRPVGSKLLHLSLGAGRSPAPRSPPPSPPGCTGGGESGGPVLSPLEPLMPKSHDMPASAACLLAAWTRSRADRAVSGPHARRAGGQSHCAGATHAPSSRPAEARKGCVPRAALGLASRAMTSSTSAPRSRRLAPEAGLRGAGRRASLQGLVRDKIDGLGVCAPGISPFRIATPFPVAMGARRVQDVVAAETGAGGAEWVPDARFGPTERPREDELGGGG